MHTITRHLTEEENYQKAMEVVKALHGVNLSDALSLLKHEVPALLTQAQTVCFNGVREALALHSHGCELVEPLPVHSRLQSESAHSPSSPSPEASPV